MSFPMRRLVVRVRRRLPRLGRTPLRPFRPWGPLNRPPHRLPQRRRQQPPPKAQLGPRPVAPRAAWGGPTSRGFLVEVGGFGFRIHDGSSEALGGGLEAGVPLSRWLAIAAWLEGSGQREPDSLYGATYRLFDVGLGLTVGTTVGRMLADVSLVPELTRATVEEGTLSEMRSEHHLWGAALGARLRIGLPLRAWCPFIFVEASHAVWAESYTAYYIHVFNGTLKLPPANGSLGLGLAYRFGTPSLDSPRRQ